MMTPADHAKSRAASLYPVLMTTMSNEPCAPLIASSAVFGATGVSGLVHDGCTSSRHPLASRTGVNPRNAVCADLIDANPPSVESPIISTRGTGAMLGGTAPVASMGLPVK
jgi:hypothetical protein